MAGTVAVQIRQWLVEQLSARGDLAGVKVHYAYPGEDLVTDRAIWTGPVEAVEVSQPTFRAGVKRRQETLVVPVIVFVRAIGASQEVADVEAAEFLTVVEEWLAATDVAQAVGALHADQQVLSMRLVGWQQLSGPLDTVGHGAGFELRVQIVARSL